MIDLITTLLKESLEIKQRVINDSAFLGQVAQVGAKLKEVVAQGGTVFACGNGGSACDSMHFVEELVARYKGERPGIRAQHFLDPGTVSCWANDYSYERVFERQVETFCGKRDILFGFSTSGNSKNVLLAFEAAKKIGTFTVGLTGRDGGETKNVCDVALVVPAQNTERIQEIHITLVHIFCEILERN